MFSPSTQGIIATEPERGFATSADNKRRFPTRICQVFGKRPPLVKFASIASKVRALKPFLYPPRRSAE